MSHHSRNPFERDDSSEIQKLIGDLRTEQKSLQGEFPDGRLNPQDEGAVSVGIGSKDGKVFIAFPHPTSWIGFTPQQAIDIANTLLHHARECGAVVTVNL